MSFWNSADEEMWLILDMVAVLRWLFRGRLCGYVYSKLENVFYKLRPGLVYLEGNVIIVLSIIEPLEHIEAACHPGSASRILAVRY
jgi:hypothetical protein